MDTNFEQKVRERAYHIWMSAGMAHGKAHEHWVIAEKAVANETGEPVKAKAKARVKASSALKAAAPTKKPAAKIAPAKAAAKTSAPKATSKASKAKH